MCIKFCITDLLSNIMYRLLSCTGSPWRLNIFLPLPQEHERVHQPGPSPSSQKPRVFNCSSCSKAFAKRSQLERHNRTHTGGKKHVFTVFVVHTSYKKTDIYSWSVVLLTDLVSFYWLNWCFLSRAFYWSSVAGCFNKNRIIHLHGPRIGCMCWMAKEVNFFVFIMLIYNNSVWTETD